MAEIITAQGDTVLVDDADYEMLSQYTWRKYKYNRSVNTSIKQKTVLMHRMIMQPPKGKVVDHINGNPMDNRRSNLRICTQGENTLNRKPNYRGASSFKGVVKDGNRWQSTISKAGVSYNLGMYQYDVLAAIAYNGAARILHGEFAKLNDIPELKSLEHWLQE